MQNCVPPLLLILPSHVVFVLFVFFFFVILSLFVIVSWFMILFLFVCICHFVIICHWPAKIKRPAKLSSSSSFDLAKAKLYFAVRFEQRTSSQLRNIPDKKHLKIPLHFFTSQSSHCGFNFYFTWSAALNFSFCKHFTWSAAVLPSSPFLPWRLNSCSSWLFYPVPTRLWETQPCFKRSNPAMPIPGIQTGETPTEKRGKDIKDRVGGICGGGAGGGRWDQEGQDCGGGQSWRAVKIFILCSH